MPNEFLCSRFAVKINYYDILQVSAMVVVIYIYLKNRKDNNRFEVKPQNKCKKTQKKTLKFTVAITNLSKSNFWAFLFIQAIRCSTFSDENGSHVFIGNIPVRISFVHCYIHCNNMVVDIIYCLFVRMGVRLKPVFGFFFLFLLFFPVSLVCVADVLVWSKTAKWIMNNSVKSFGKRKVSLLNGETFQYVRSFAHASRVIYYICI